MPQFGYKFNRISTDSTLHIPSFCGVPNITDYIKNGMIAIDTCNNVLFQWTRSNGWTPISTGTYLDTTSLSNRINQRVKYTDTAAMLLPYLKKTDTLAMLSRYLRKSDTASLSNRINLKVNISDTAAMLLPYLKKTDTLAMLSRYLRKSDTASLSNRINLKQNVLGRSYPIRINNDIVSIAQAGYFTNGYIDSFQFRTFLSKVDTIYRESGKDSIYISANGLIYQIKDSVGGTLSRAVDTIQRESGKDSIIFTILGKRYAIKDSTGVGGAATRLTTTVYNNSGSTITKGSVIYINGAHSSNLPIIALAKADKESTSAYTYGLVETDIPNNSQGTVIQNGVITNLNLPTSTYTDGQTLYLSPTVAGGYTLTKPLAPYHYVAIGTITRAHPNFGTIQIAIRNGFQLDELSDVKIALVPLDSTILQFSRVDSLWHDVNPTTAMGNRFVKNISRVAGKDSIIFNIGSTRYAIKDSTGSGNPAGNNGYVQFNNSGSFGGDSSLYWNNTNKRLGIGTTQPQNKFDVISGNVSGGMNRGLFETASFTKNGDNKVGIYNGGNFNTGGASITFGHTKNTNSAGYYPGFEFQNGNDSVNPENSFMRYNYIQRDNTGGVAGYVADIMRINANGSVVINGASAYDVFGSTPRLIVGDDNTGANFEVSGNAYIHNGLISNSEATINGELYTNGARIKHISSFQDDGNADYYVQSNDHILIIYFSNNNVNIHLPENPPDGREIIIKAWGFLDDYYTSIYASGDNEIVVGNTYYNSTQPVDILHNTEPNSMTLIYDNSIGDGVWFILNGQVQ